MNIRLKETCLLSAALFLVIMLVVPAIGAQEETLNETKYADTSNVVSTEQAEKVASYSVKKISGSISDLSEWKNATVKLSTVYYDLEGKKSAYSFNVIKNEQQIGSIFISATKDNCPVLEFSKGNIPNEIPEFMTRSKSLVQERANKIKLESTDKEELTIGKMKPLYLGPTFYYAEYTITDTKGKAKEKVIVDLPISTIVNFNESNVSIPKDKKDYFLNNTYLQQQRETRKQNANKQWTALEKEMADSSSYSAASTVERSISGVPNYIWRKGCSPTAAGMVLGYWDSHGYPNFPGETTLIDELADLMGTSDWPRGYGATWPWDIDTGIQAVCVMHLYFDFDVSDIFNSSVTWDAVKNEVNANRPFILSMLHGGTAVGNSQAYNEHSVTCMGYSDGDGNNDYLLLHDTWNNTTTRYLAYNSWWGAMATWVRP